MKTRKQDMPTIGVENIDKYVLGKKEIYNRHFVIMPDGSQFYIINDKYVPAEMMDNTPPELKKKGVFKGNALDGRTNWIE